LRELGEAGTAPEVEPRVRAQANVRCLEALRRALQERRKRLHEMGRIQNEQIAQDYLFSLLFKER